jgi:hypothetical protein
MTKRMLLLEGRGDVVVLRLNDADAAAARDIHRHDPMARACQRAICEPLFDQLPEFRRGGGRNGGTLLTPSDAFRALIVEYWFPFMRAAMNSIWTLGVVPIVFRPIGIDAHNDRVPVVPELDYGHLLMRYDHGTDQRSYVFVRHATGEPDPTVLVLDGFGADPSPDGRLTTVAASLMQEAEFLAVMRRGAVRAERARTDPAVLIERPEKNSAAPHDDDAFKFENLYYNADDDSEAAHEQRSKRNREQGLEQRRARADFAQRVRARILEARGLAGTSVAGGSAMLAAAEDDSWLNDYEQSEPLELPNFFDLPPGNKVAAHGVAPEARRDYLDILRMHQEVVCTQYGVDRSRLTGEGTRVRGNEQGTAETYRRTMLYWRRVLGRLLTIVYRMLYSRDDAEAVMRARAGESAPPMTPEEAFALGVSQRIEVHIAYVPAESTEELIRLYASGSVTDDEFWRYTRLNAALPVDGHARDPKDAWAPLVRSSVFEQMHRPIMAETPWSLQIAAQAAQAEQAQMQLKQGKLQLQVAEATAKSKMLAATAAPASGAGSAKKK